MKSFKHRDVHEVPNEFLTEHFERNEEKVADFVTRISATEDRAKAQLEFQKALFSGVMNPLVSRYSKFHEISVYMHGYDHPETLRLADTYVLLFLVSCFVDLGAQVWRTFGFLKIGLSVEESHITQG